MKVLRLWTHYGWTRERWPDSAISRGEDALVLGISCVSECDSGCNERTGFEDPIDGDDPNLVPGDAQLVGAPYCILLQDL